MGNSYARLTRSSDSSSKTKIDTYLEGQERGETLPLLARVSNFSNKESSLGRHVGDSNLRGGELTRMMSVGKHITYLNTAGIETFNRAG